MTYTELPQEHKQYITDTLLEMPFGCFMGEDYTALKKIRAKASQLRRKIRTKDVDSLNWHSFLWSFFPHDWQIQAINDGRYNVVMDRIRLDAYYKNNEKLLRYMEILLKLRD